MRILTGKYKGKGIALPRGIRPTQNKVRKALFDILGDIAGLAFLELFAGSGAVGLEALSRGVAQLSLVERDRDCLGLIQKNIESLKLANVLVYPFEAERAIRFFHAQKQRFEIIFMDPPYSLGLAKKALQILEACDILAPNGFIVIQHFKKDALPDALGVLNLFRQYKYGDTLLSFYRK